MEKDSKAAKKDEKKKLQDEINALFKPVEQKIQKGCAFNHYFVIFI